MLNRISYFHKKILSIIILTIICGSLNSCIVRSLYPFCNINDSLKIDSLKGRWINEEKDAEIIISDFEDDTRFYTVKYSDKNKTLEYGETGTLIHEENNSDTGILTAMLFKISDDYFFDFTLNQIEPEIKVNDALYLIAAHSVSKIKLNKKNLIFYYLNYNKMQEYKANDKVKNLRCFKSDDKSDSSILLTSETKDLKKFLKKYKDEKNLFELSIEYKKIE